MTDVSVERPSRVTTRRKRRRSRALARLPVYGIAVLLAAIVLVPLVYVVVGGFRTTGQIAADPVGLPDPWITSNYTEILGSGTFWQEATALRDVAFVLQMTRRVKAAIISEGTEPQLSAKSDHPVGV